MKIISGKDGADLLPPRTYNPNDIDLPLYELWLVQKNMELIAEQLAVAFQPFVDALIKIGQTIEQLPDEKVVARQRSKDDLNRKRKDLMKRRGKK